ncbi:MAG: PilZ domain-containing protein [Terriglobales bacterium]|jgi:PilZ domain-containing protein
MPASNGHTVRRSSRVPIQVPIRVTSMESDAQFSEICETLVVSAHGCALRFPLELATGSALRLHSRGGRQATAYVVFCQPMGPDGPGFRLGAQLDRPENFWGLASCPDDWRVVEMPTPAAQKPPQKLAAKSFVLHQPQTPSRASRDVPDKIEEQLSEERLRGILAKLVRPLQAEVTELREKLAVNAKRNRFEVSLGYIPPELEEQLWERLRQDLGTRALQQTREQSAEMLGATKTAIEQKISAALTEFRHRLAGELHAVEQRAQVLSKELTSTAQQQVRTGIEKLQRQALETGAHLDAQGEKLLCSLQGQLADSHEVHLREIEQIQADAAAKASQLKSEVSDLGRRMAALNESVRRIESDLDAHLERVAAEIVSGAEAQIESAVALALKNLQARSSNEVETRLNEMCGHLRTIQNRIEDSFSSSVTAQGEGAVQSIVQQFEELAQQSTEKWRLALAKDLNSVATTLGRQLRQELEPEAGQS